MVHNPGGDWNPGGGTTQLTSSGIPKNPIGRAAVSIFSPRLSDGKYIYDTILGVLKSWNRFFIWQVVDYDWPEVFSSFGKLIRVDTFQRDCFPFNLGWRRFNQWSFPLVRLLHNFPGCFIKRLSFSNCWNPYRVCKWRVCIDVFLLGDDSRTSPPPTFFNTELPAKRKLQRRRNAGRDRQMSCWNVVKSSSPRCGWWVKLENGLTWGISMGFEDDLPKVTGWYHVWYIITLPETNIFAPENGWLGD